MTQNHPYQYRKLNDLLCTSFNNVKYDIRSLNQLTNSLKDQIAHLSSSSVLSALEEQNNIILEQQKAINTLMIRLDNLDLHKGQEIVTATVQKTAKKEAKPEIKEGEVRITKTNFKAKGNGKKDLNGEWVEVTGYDVDMTGFTLHDNNKKHTFRFPDGFKIYGPVRIFTGQGKNTNTKLYWNSPRPVWNDNGDVATLRDGRKIVSQVKSEITHTFEVLK